MNWLMRRYKEDGNISYLFVLAFCFVMTLVLFSLSCIFISGRSYWSILPIAGFISAAIQVYSLTSYSKPKYKEEGHYKINEFYKVINGTKKVNFFLEYFAGLIGINATIHFLFHGYLLEKFQNENLNNGILVLFFIFSSVSLFWIRLFYFKKINQEPISNLDSIEFFKNFFFIEHAKWTYDGYIKHIENLDNDSILNGDGHEKLSKKNLISNVDYLKSKHKDLLKKNEMSKTASKRVKNILTMKEKLSAINEK